MRLTTYNIGDKEVYLDSNKYMNNYHFTVLSYVAITDEEVKDLQLKAGFHPAGYGGPWQIDRVVRNKINVTSWHCAGSCD